MGGIYFPGNTVSVLSLFFCDFLTYASFHRAQLVDFDLKNNTEGRLVYIWYECDPWFFYRDRLRN